MELDSHADTSAFGKDCKVINDTGQTVTVEGFHQASMALNEVKIATIAVAYDCPTTFRTYILFFFQCLYIPTLDFHLVNPFQLRENGVIVNEIPLIHTDPANRHPESHSILVEDPLLQIPLSLRGTMSGFTTRIPSQEEIDDLHGTICHHVHMTAEAHWDPHDKTHRRLEHSLRADISSDYELRVLESRDISPSSEGTG